MFAGYIGDFATHSMSLYRFALGETLRSLQESADRCARAFSSYKVKLIYRVLYAANTPYPWRLVEVHRLEEKVNQEVILKRRMHCFGDSGKLRRSLSERILWKFKDRAFVSTHLFNSKQMLTQKELLSEAQLASAACNSMNEDLLKIEDARRQLRQSICQTHPDQMIELTVEHR